MTTETERTRPKITEEMVKALTVEAAEELMNDLIVRNMGIDTQLTARMSERVHDNKGVRDSYYAWKRGAVFAKNQNQKAIIWLKAHIKAERTKEIAERVARPLGTRAARVSAYFAEAYRAMELDPNDPVAVLAALFDTMQFILDDGAWEPSPDEKAVLAAAQTILEAHGMATR